MKRLLLMLAVGLPFAVAAESADKAQKIKVDAEKLRQAMPASVLLNEEVRTQAGQDAGSLEDIVISRDGKVQHFVVDANRENLQEQDAATSGEDMDLVADERGSVDRGAADQRQAQTEPVYERTGGGGLLSENVVEVKPESVSYDSAAKALTIDEKEILSARPVSDDRVAQSGEALRVSELMGMQVDLADEDSFGSVEDVMLGENNAEVVAVVVDSWDGLDKQRHALPMEGVQINAEDQALRYEYSAADVQALPEFNLDRYTDDGWDMTDW